MQIIQPNGGESKSHLYLALGKLSALVLHMGVCELPWKISVYMLGEGSAKPQLRAELTEMSSSQQQGQQKMKQTV